MTVEIPEKHRELFEEWVEHVEDEETTAYVGAVVEDDDG